MGDTRPLLVAYGIAEQLAETAESLVFLAMLATVNEWKKKKMAGPPFAERPIVVIVCSTTGNGGASENAEKLEIRALCQAPQQGGSFRGHALRRAGSRRHELR
jgi:sulfite reductase alpha subunit-like flavoprotein